MSRFPKHRSPFLQAAKLAMLGLPLLLASPSKAYGYIDPGSGAFVYQAAYAAFLGMAFYLRKFVKRFWKQK